MLNTANRKQLRTKIVQNGAPILGTKLRPLKIRWKHSKPTHKNLQIRTKTHKSYHVENLAVAWPIRNRKVAKKPKSWNQFFHFDGGATQERPGGEQILGAREVY